MKFIISSLVLILTISFHSVSAQKNMWKKIAEAKQRATTEPRLIIPKKYALFTFNYDAFSNFQNEKSRSSIKEFIMDFPLPDGSIQQFRMIETPVFEEGLSSKYPGFYSFTGRGITTPDAYLKMSMSPFGINVMILHDEWSTVFIDPYSQFNQTEYIVYHKNDLGNKIDKFSCGVGSSKNEENKKHVENNHQEQNNAGNRLVSDCTLRSYRLALACTGEYASFQGGTVAKVLAAYNNSITRVNGIYERDAAITMKIIANTDKLIYLNGSSDPYSNNDGGTMLDQNQSNIDSKIGFSNYDIGHVFSTGGGGIAELRAPCSSSKAMGVTGSSSPVGDPFDIDYVAHEMGHQFGANHTFNNSCGDNRNDPTAVEPGSGSSIMGYAGICDPNVTGNSDDHFHAISLAEIANFVVAGSGNSCAVRIDIDNQKPDVTVVKNSYTIPVNTAFRLTASGTDADGDLLTYCWEQMDSEVTTMPPKNTNVSGPAFRSLPPSTSPTRYFPDLQKRYVQWEVLPNVVRNMNFRCTVRDNNPAGGCTDEVNVALKVNNTAGPFLVTYPNSALVNWQVGSMQTVTWDVAKTDIAPVNCSLVNILLSSDGGKSYPYALASKVPNTGSYKIETPNLPSATTKVMVVADDNVFFDVSNANFKITTTFALSSNLKQVDICNQTSLTFNITLTKVQDINQDIQLGIENPPAGLQYAFSLNPVAVPGNTILTLSNIQALPYGTNSIKVIASAGTEKLSTIIDLFVGNRNQSPVTLDAPVKFATSVAVNNASFAWQSLPGINNYIWELSSNPAFEPIIKSATVSTNSYKTNLEPAKVYYWRVKASSPCVEIPYSSVSSFKTVGGLTGPATVLINELLVVDAGQSETITDNQLSVSSVDPSKTKFSITSLPSEGILKVENNNLSIGSIFTMADITSGILSYTHSGGSGENDHFVFDILDDQNRWLPDVTFSIKIRQANLGVAAFREKGLLCHGDTDGIIRAEGFGGNAPYTFSLDNVNFVSENSFNNLASGTYIVYIKDALGSEMISNTIVLSEPDEVMVTVQPDKYDIVMFASGGTGSLQFSTDDIVYSTTNIIKDPGNGLYRLYVRDDNGCKKETDVILDIAPITIASSLTKDILCSGQKATLMATASGGIPPYTFGINGDNFQANPVFSLNAGSYVVAVKDSGDKIVFSDTIKTSQPAPISVVLVQDKFQVTVNATGGTGLLQFSKDGVNYTSDNIISFNDNGTYKIYTRDENQCTKINSITLNILNKVNETVKQITCNGQNNGYIKLIAANGTAPFKYSLNGSPFSSTREWSNLMPGNYNYIVKDNKNDSISASIVITQPDSLKIEPVINQSELTINALGGTPPYTYSIDGGSVFLANSVFNELPDNAYDIAVKDKNGCIVHANISISGYKDITSNVKIVVYPNPGTGIFRLKGDIPSLYDSEIKVIDLMGHSINKPNLISKSSGEWIIDIQDMPAGTYIVLFKTKLTTASALLIKL